MKRRPERLQVGEQVLDVGAVAEPGPGLHAADLDDPREHVRQRQEQQRRGVVGGEELVELVHGDAELEHEVAVGEHAALGPARGSRRVDQRRQVEGGGGGTPLLELLVADVRTEPGEHVDGVVVDRPDVVELVEAGARLGDPGHVRGVLGDDRAGAGVAQDPGDLLRGGGLVDRHGDRAGEPDRVVDERPLVAGLGDEGDPVPGPDAGRDQALGDGADLVEERGSRDVLPPLPGVPAEDDRVAGLPGVRDDVVGEVPGGGDLDRQGRGELTHGTSSGAPGATAASRGLACLHG